MNKRYTFKPIFLAVLFATLLMVVVASNVYAGGPQSFPPGTFVLAKSKSVDGFLNAVAMPNGEIVQYIVVTCKEAEGVIGPEVDAYSADPDNLADTTAECLDNDLCLEGQIFQDVLSRAYPSDPVPEIFACFSGAQEYFEDRLAYCLAMLKEYSLAFQQIRASGKVSLETYTSGM